MGLDTPPIQHGLRVPKIFRWSAEQDITPRVYPMRGPVTEGEPVTSPPLHLPGAWESVRHCRHLLEGYSAARVTDPVQWGAYGILHEQVGANDVIPIDIRAQVPYGSHRLGMLLAGQAVVQFQGARNVDLIAEAARACLPGSGVGR
ncbi:hypothetical protein [Streptomyces sp. NPDC055607]